MTLAMPTGWGFLPGRPMNLGPDDLPDLPLLCTLSPKYRNNALIQAVSAIDGLAAALRPRDLKRKYGIPPATAAMVLSKARIGA